MGWEGITLEPQSDFAQKLVSLCRGSAADLYNALMYLSQKGFINLMANRSSAGDSLHDFSVTSGGIDIIEGIERGQAERNNFYITFNIKLADNINIESLLKNEIGSILKGSLI